MPVTTNRTANTLAPSTKPNQGSLADPLADPLASGGGPSQKQAKKEQVVVYLTQNNTTHHTDEIPEALASIQKAEKDGKGSKKLIPISDPYKDGTRTEGGAFGEKAAKEMTWWHDDKSLKPGQVRIKGKVLTLGAQDGVDTDLLKIQEDWKELLIAAGLSKARAASAVTALMSDATGKAKLMASGAGASNELAQLIAVLDRAENGEFDIATMVLSGHHYSGTEYLFGENEGHVYDDDTTFGDTLNMRDIEALKGVFPTAFKQVKSVMFNACNTYDLGMENEKGESKSTNEWLQGTFPSIESSSYWKGIAPGPDMGAFYAGEFLQDTAKKGAGDKAAFKDARYQSTASGSNVRSEKNASGKLDEITTTRNSSSYVYNDYKGLRNSANVSYNKRNDLKKNLKTKP